MTMIFHELTIHTNTLGSELVGGVLMGAGVSCFVTEDFNDLNEVIEEKSIPFDYIEDALLADPGEVKVKVYLACNEQGKLQEEEILSGITALKEAGEFDLGSLEVTFSHVDEKDWADNWKQYFHPLPIGNRFIVKPTWEEYTGEDRIVLEIDPASSFGTGQHETTALCLEELEDMELSGKSLLDMGCGSGILGIGAALLGAEDVVCVDIEQIAVETTRENAGINGLQEGVLKAYHGNILTDEALCATVMEADRYDYIAANIVADVIIAMLPMFKTALKSGGTMVLSGIISPKKDVVLDALLKAGFTVSTAREKNDWAVIVCQK